MAGSIYKIIYIQAGSPTASAVSGISIVTSFDLASPRCRSHDPLYNLPHFVSMITSVFLFFSCLAVYALKLFLVILYLAFPSHAHIILIVLFQSCLHRIYMICFPSYFLISDQIRIQFLSSRYYSYP